MLSFKNMIGRLCVVLALSAHLAAQTELPQLRESRELNTKVIKLFSEAKYDEALPLAKRALELRETALGSTHQDLIPLLSNLGEILKAKRKLGESRAYFQRAFDIAEKAFAEDDIRLAHLADKLGLIAYEQDDKKDASRFFARSLDIKIKVLGADNAEVAPTLYNLAEIYRLRGEYEKAEPLYERLVNIREKSPGKDNVDLQRAVEGYIDTLLALKKSAQVDSVQERINRLFAAQGIVRGGVLNGRALKLVQPEYPLAARVDHASALVRVAIVIGEDGKVLSAKTMNSEPVHPALAAAAENAARRSLFTPTYLSGVAVKVSGVIIYRFVAQ